MNEFKLNDKFEVYSKKSGKTGTGVIKQSSRNDAECIVNIHTPSGSFWSQMTLEKLKNSTLYKIGKRLEN